MQELLEQTPETVAAFRDWSRRAIEKLTTRVDGDVRGPLTTEQHAEAAELVRAAKLFAFKLGLVQLCDRLPAQEYKCAVDAIRRLQEAIEWNEPAPMPQDGRAMTVLQAADVLGVCESVARDLVTSGELGSHRVGNGRGQIRILPSDIAQYQRRAERPAFRHLGR